MRLVTVFFFGRRVQIYLLRLHPASSLVQDRESSPAETSVLPTMLRRQRGEA